MKRLFLSLIALAILGCAGGQKVETLALGQTGWLSYPSSVEKLQLSGQLQLPAGGKPPFPAIVLAHASGGLDARVDRWAAYFRSQGIATLSIDYFGPRGVTATSATQPIPTHDAYDALRLLGSHPLIAPGRIAIIGFSRGGNLVLNAADMGAHEAGGQQFAGYIALYPSCGVANIRKGDGAPVLIMLGSRDDLVPVVQCETLVDNARSRGRSAQLAVFEGGHHGWDGDFSGIWYHRALNTSYTLQADTRITELSRLEAMRFLTPLLFP